jgi:hypothetical protein
MTNTIQLVPSPKPDLGLRNSQIISLLKKVRETLFPIIVVLAAQVSKRCRKERIR